MESWGWNTLWALYGSKSLRSARLDSLLDNNTCGGSSCQLESPGLALFLWRQEEVLSIPCLFHFPQHIPFINLGNAASPLGNIPHLTQATVASRAEKMDANALSPPGSECQGLHSHSDAALISVAAEGQNLQAATFWARWAPSLFRSCIHWFEMCCSGGRYTRTWRNVPWGGSQTMNVTSQNTPPAVCMFAERMSNMRLFIGNSWEVLLCNFVNIKEWRNPISVCR